jgi:hypothetical protein
MNPELEAYAREYIRINIKKLKDEHIHIFKKMYSSNNLEANIDNVINNMTKDKLNWAMQQITNSLLKEGIEIWSFRKTFTN